MDGILLIRIAVADQVHSPFGRITLDKLIKFSRVRGHYSMGDLYAQLLVPSVYGEDNLRSIAHTQAFLNG